MAKKKLLIKTIRNRLDNAAHFDNEVNEALRNGWTLTKRCVLRPFAQQQSNYCHIMLYAELEKEVVEYDGE